MMQAASWLTAWMCLKILISGEHTTIFRVDRVAKYNELLRIEEELDDLAVYPGPACFYNLS